MSWPKPLKPNRVAFWKAAIDLNRGCLSVHDAPMNFWLLAVRIIWRATMKLLIIYFGKLLIQQNCTSIGTHVMLNSISNDNDLWVCVMKHLSSKNFYRFLHTKRNYSYKCVSYLFKKTRFHYPTFYLYVVYL